MAPEGYASPPGPTAAVFWPYTKAFRIRHPLTPNSSIWLRPRVRSSTIRGIAWHNIRQRRCSTSGT